MLVSENSRKLSVRNGRKAMGVVCRNSENSGEMMSKCSVNKANHVLSVSLPNSVVNPPGLDMETVQVDEMLDSSHAIIKWPAPQPPAAVIPRNATMMDISIYLGRVQTYINQLGYQRQGEPKIKVNTQMSVKHLLDTAKSIIKAGEQIKCLHALVLAIHFTNCTQIIERFPINFKSEFGGKEYKHVVLGIYLYGYFGALGISRDNGLQDKPPSFTRLSDMINDFHTCYTESGHTLLEVKIGGIITHDPYSLEPIPWKLHVFNVKKLSEMEVASGIERCAKLLRSKMGSNCLKNTRPIIIDTVSNNKPLAILPSVSTNVNTANVNRNVTRSRKVIKSKYNMDIHVNVSPSAASRLSTKK